MEEPFASTRPIYLQIIDRMCRAIVRRELAPGDKVPSVREAAIAYGVNPNTVQRTYAELERRAIVETRRGQGTFVTEDRERLDALRLELQEDALERLVQTLRDMGLRESEILEGLKRYLARHSSVVGEGGHPIHD